MVSTRKSRLKKKSRTKKVFKGGNSTIPTPNIKFAVMAQFKNEAMTIKEWVEHYKWQGADEIVLLDNESTDGGGDLVRNLEHVTVISAPGKHAQIENYLKLGLPWLKEKKMDVVAIVDLDEFMFGTDGKNLKQHVIEIFGKSPRPSQFSCNWTMFGSSGYEKQPESIRKSFTWRDKDIIGPTTVWNQKSVIWINDLKERGIYLHKSEVTGETIQCPPGIQLNHYPIQSKEYFEKVKMTRGDAFKEEHENIRNWDYFKSYDHKVVEDTKLRDLVMKQSGGMIKRYSLKKKLKNIGRISKRHVFVGGEGDGKCIYVKLAGGKKSEAGLGNQLFIYAAGIVVKNRTGLPLCLVRSTTNPHSKKNYTKVLFKQGSGVNEVNSEQKIKNSKKIHEGLGLYNKWINQNIPVNKSTNIFLSGYLYQNYESIKSALPSMREEFSKEFAELYPNEFSELKDPNIQKKTACVHVRRGDFVEAGESSPIEYFNKALVLLESNKGIDTLYIVSEDVDWCRAQKWETTKKIIYFGDPDEIKTLYLMMLCKGGFILSASSTYSAWGAMLGADANPDSTIVYHTGWGINLMFPARWNMI